MSYVESHLLNGGKIEHMSHLHWKLYAVPGLIEFMILIASIGIIASGHLGAGILVY